MLLLLPVIMYSLDLMAGTVLLSAFTGQLLPSWLTWEVKLYSVSNILVFSGHLINYDCNIPTPRCGTSQNGLNVTLMGDLRKERFTISIFKWGFKMLFWGQQTDIGIAPRSHSRLKLAPIVILAYIHGILLWNWCLPVCFHALSEIRRYQ